MVIDAHLHCTGDETAEGVLRALDEADTDIGVLLAPFLHNGYSMHDPASLRRANAHLAGLVKGHEDRLVGFSVLNPADPGAVADLDRCLEMGLRGIKMVPSGWSPEDDRVQPLFARAAQHRLPLLFHSGIFIDGRSSRFCRPAGFEPLRDHPGVRVTLAHLSWPWCDEAIAVGLIDRIHGVPPERMVFRFDLSFGPPPPYRLEVLRKALDVLGADCLQYGSDCFFPCDGAHIAERRRWLVDLLDQLEVGREDRERIFFRTAATWLGLVPPAQRLVRETPAEAPGPRAGGLFSSLTSRGAQALRAAGGTSRHGRLRWMPTCC